MERLRQRADFLAAAGGRKVAMPGFVLQARGRDDNTGPIRVGFTVSRKVGNAVERNRVRRRLKNVVRLSATARLRAGHDYVVIGRRAALQLPFERMIEEFGTALQRLDRPATPARDTDSRSRPPARRQRPAAGQDRGPE